MRRRGCRQGPSNGLLAQIPIFFALISAHLPSKAKQECQSEGRTVPLENPDLCKRMGIFVVRENVIAGAKPKNQQHPDRSSLDGSLRRQGMELHGLWRNQTEFSVGTTAIVSNPAALVWMKSRRDMPLMVLPSAGSVSRFGSGAQ